MKEGREVAFALFFRVGEKGRSSQILVDSQEYRLDMSARSKEDEEVLKESGRRAITQYNKINGEYPVSARVSLRERTTTQFNI